MAWFGKREKKAAPPADAVNARIKVLGSGCSCCRALEKSTAEALKQLGTDTAVEHVTDLARIAAYGVMRTPALVVDGKVVSSGQTLKTEEIVRLLREAGV